jgi:hypothetical protein
MTAFRTQQTWLGFEGNEADLKKYPFGGTVPMTLVFHQDGSAAAL